MASEGSGAAVVVSVGARKVQLEDVLLVAVHKARVDLHQASLDKACPPRRDGTKDKPFDVSDHVVIVDPNDALPESAARAALFARIVSYMNGKSGLRKEVITLMCDMLNKGLIPLVAKDGSGDGPALATALLGDGMCFIEGEVRPTSHASSSCGFSPLADLTAAEGDTLTFGRFDQIGVGAMAAAAAYNAIEIADGIAALTCEAARASTSHFDAAIFDLRPHRGQMSCAERLRVMLEGSKFANSKKGNGADPEAIRSIPRRHGPARDAISAACRSVSTELNAADAEPLGEGQGCAHPRDGHQTALAVTFLSEAIKMLIGASEDRLCALRAIAAERTTNSLAGGDSGSYSEGGSKAVANRDVDGMLRKLQSVLASEIAWSMAMVGEEEGKAAAASAASAEVNAIVMEFFALYPLHALDLITK